MNGKVRTQQRALQPLESAVDFNELDNSRPTSRTGDDNTFVKRIGSDDRLFKRVTIPANRIREMVKAHRLNPRVQRFLNKISLARLMSDIKTTGGVQQPPVCVLIDGIYYILDGSRRVEASALLEIPLAIEYTCDAVSDEDCLLYINATDTNENQSAFEKAASMHNDYIDVKSAWERENSERWVDDVFTDLRGISRATLSRTKKILGAFSAEFFEKGDPNKFRNGDLINLCTVAKKQRLNNPDTFYEKVGDIFVGCLEKWGDDWDFDNFKSEFLAVFNAKLPAKPTESASLCMLTLERGDDFEDAKVGLVKKKKSFTIELPFEYNKEAADKLRDFILREFDN